MTRAVACITAVLALAASGCGGDEPDYGEGVRTVNASYRTIVRDFVEFDFGVATTTAEARAAYARLSRGLARSADRLEQLEAPADLEDEHGEVVAALLELSALQGRNGKALGRGGDEGATSDRVGASITRLARAWNRLEAKLRERGEPAFKRAG